MALTINAEDPKVIAATVDQAHAAGDELVDRANADVSAIEATAAGQVAVALKTFADTVSGAVTSLQGTIAGLDGWTLTLDPPLIIRSIRLSKPKGE